MSQHENTSTVAAPVAKAITAWAAVGISSWQEAAAAAAFFYSLLLIFEWWWKKFWRPMLEARGILKPRRSRREDADTESGAL